MRQQPGHAEPPMTTWKRPRLSWSRLGIGISIGLVLFGAIDATLPHSARPDSVAGVADDPRFRGHNGRPRRRCRSRTAQLYGWPRSSLLPPTPPIRHHPEGDTVERAAVAPGLAVPRRVAWPEAWVAEDRRTTVVLDPPGPVVAVGVWPGCRGRHWSDGRDHRCRPELGGAAGRTDHAASHRPDGPGEPLALGGRRCRDRLVNTDPVETVSG